MVFQTPLGPLLKVDFMFGIQSMERPLETIQETGRMGRTEMTPKDLKKLKIGDEVKWKGLSDHPGNALKILDIRDESHSHNRFKVTAIEVPLYGWLPHFRFTRLKK